MYVIAVADRDNSLKVWSMSPTLYRDVPARFRWTPSTDVEGCMAYIDALVSGRRTIADTYERKGYVSQIEMPEPVQEQRIRVTVKGFVDYLLLRGHIDIPLNSRLLFMTEGQKVVPRDYIAALAPLLESTGDAGALSPTDDWRHLNRETLEQIGGQDSLTLGRNRVAGVSDAPATEVEASPGALPDDAEFPAEVEVRRRLLDRHADLLTKVLPAGQTPFYARRLIDYRGHLLWSGSSWEERGPWRVSHRDAPRLLALGVSEPS
jgi:hypothetical protein